MHGARKPKQVCEAGCGKMYSKGMGPWGLPVWKGFKQRAVSIGNIKCKLDTSESLKGF